MYKDLKCHFLKLFEIVRKQRYLEISIRYADTSVQYNYIHSTLNYVTRLKFFKNPINVKNCSCRHNLFPPYQTTKKLIKINLALTTAKLSKKYLKRTEIQKKSNKCQARVNQV